MKKSKTYPFRLAIVFASIILLLSYVSCDSITEPLLDNKKVILMAPSDSVTTTDSAQIFVWNLLKDSAQYELQVVSPNFDTIRKVVIDTLLNGNQYPLILSKGKYSWRVRAKNYSSSSKYSDVWRLVIE